MRRADRAYRAPPLALSWIGEVFLGLEHMHLRMTTLLRDLKPENVVLDASGRAKLTDFGFGRFGIESTGRWSFGIPTGSPGYVAPEVLQREQYDARADLYSFGVLVWVLLTGGRTSALDPIPPIGVMRHRADFEAHHQDWLRLQRCVSDPAHNGAPPLREDARDFVARLTQRHKNSRIRHREIRLHAFMLPMRLPDYDARPDAVEAWLSAQSSSPATTPATETSPKGLSTQSGSSVVGHYDSSERSNIPVHGVAATAAATVAAAPGSAPMAAG